MMPTELNWAPGPPPPADGLQAAFRAADRRRARTAVAAAVPVVVAVALAMTTTLQSGGTDSLQLPPAKHGPVTSGDRQTADMPGVDAPPAADPGTQLAPAAAPPAAGAQAGGQLGGDQSHPAAARPTPPPRPAPAGSLDLVAQHSARVQVRLAKPTHPSFARAVFKRSGRYAGIWVVNARGAVVGSALEVVGPNGGEPQRYDDTPSVLPAGTYTFYVVGEGRTEARVPVGSGEQGVKMTATRTVSASYLTKTYTMSTIETNVVLRMHLPTTTSIGYVGGYIDTPGGTASSVDVCLPHRDADCAAGDPHQNNNSQITVDGGYGVTFDATPALLRQRRDVLLGAQSHGTGSTMMVCWSFTVALS